VVDASVAVKWVVEEEHSAEAVRLLQCETRHAPTHWQAEAASVLWSKVFKRELSAEDAGERMRVLLRAPVLTADIADLLPRAFRIAVAQSVTIYDSLYVALAENLTVPLVTADRKLIQRLAGALPASQLLWVGDIGPTT